MKANSNSYRGKTLIRGGASILAGLAAFLLLPLLIFASFSPEKGALAFCEPLYRYLFLGSGVAAGVLQSFPAITLSIAASVFLTGAYLLSRRSAGRKGLFFLPAGLALALAGYELASRRQVMISALLLLAALGAAGYASRSAFKLLPPLPAGSRRWCRRGLALVLLIAAINCSYRLESIPDRLSGWEVSGGLSVIQLFQGDVPGYPRSLWSTLERPYNGTPSSPFSVYPLAVLIKIFGVSVLTIRSAGVFWGLLSLLLLYLLTENLFGPRTALLAAFFTSVSPWFLSIARLGNYINLSLCYVLAVLYFFSLALRGKISAFFVVGLFLSFFSYFYLPVKILFPALGLIWLHYTFLDPVPWRKKAIWLMAMLTGFFLFQILIGNPLPHISGTAMPFYLGRPPGALGLSVPAAVADLKHNCYSVFYNLFYRSQNLVFPAPRGLLLNRFVLLLGILGFGWSAGRWRDGPSFFISATCLAALLPILLSSSVIGSFPVDRRGFLLAAFIPILAAIAFNALLAASSAFWPRMRPLHRRVPAGLCLLIIGAFSVTGYFISPTHPYFSIKRHFAEHALRLSRQGYYLEIGESDYNLRQLLDFLSFPRTRRLYTYYSVMPAALTHRGRLSDLTYYRSLGENPLYSFWTVDNFPGVLAAIGESGRKTAILYEIEVGELYRPLLAAIADTYPGWTITEIRDPQNRIVGVQALLEG